MMRRWILLFGVLVAPPLRAQTPEAPDTLPLTLQEAVTRALRVGDEARIAAARVDAAEAQIAVARANGLPQLRLSGSFSHVYENARAQAVGQIFNQPNTFNVSAALSQTLFQGGRVLAATRAASNVHAAAEMTAAEARTQIAFDVLRAYLQALLANRIVEIQSASFAQATSHLEQVEQLERAGRVSRYDLLRARVDRANLEPALIQAQNDRELALLELKRLTNIPVDRPIALTTVIEPEQVEAIAAAIAADSSDGRDRPSLRAAEFTARARREGVRIARADLLPTVSISLQSGYQAYPMETRFPLERGRLETQCPPGTPPGRTCHNGGWFSDRLLGLNVSWPLFTGFRTKASIDAAQAEARLAELALAQQREAVALEIARARAGLERARALYEAQRQNAVEAEEAYRLASLRFSRGLSTQLDVSAAQLALLTAQTNQARAIYELYLAAAELARALGRPIPLPDGTQAPE